MFPPGPIRSGVGPAADEKGSTDMMLTYRGCHRCEGPTRLSVDLDGPFTRCTSCGWTGPTREPTDDEKLRANKPDAQPPTYESSTNFDRRRRKQTQRYRDRQRVAQEAAGMTPHTCHAHGCDTTIPPKLFMCRPHWYMVPKVLRAEIWRTYRPGQEIDKSPTDEYLQIAVQAIAAVRDREAA